MNRSYADTLDTYKQVSNVIKAFSEQTELEKYYDMYDISDFDMSEALQGYRDGEFEDVESLRTLKALAARFHTLRKMLLCALLALDTSEQGSELFRWTAVAESLRSLGKVTKTAYERLRDILSAEECEY